MKRVMARLLLLLLTLLVFGGGVHGFGDNEFSQEDEWEDVEYEERLTGRDFVALGELHWIEGLLFTEDDEWFLRDDDEVYEVHLGDHTYREELGLHLEEGKEASIYGFLYEDDMAVVSLTTDGETYYFRTEQGTPLWGAFGGGEEGRELLMRTERREELEKALQIQALEEERVEEKVEEEKTTEEKEEE